MRGFCLIWLTGREKNSVQNSTISFRFFDYICTLSPPNDGIACPPHSPPVTHPLHALLCLGHLFLVFVVFWSANWRPIVDGVCVGVPNKGTGRGTAKPDHGRLAWDHRRPRHHVLRAPLTYPWRERAKSLESRAAVAHVGCFVYCVLCFVLARSFS